MDGFLTTQSSLPRGKCKLYSIWELINCILDDNRSLLSKAITLVESNSNAHHETANEVLKALLPHVGKSI